ncbi:MAG: hypothetical protein Q4F57_04565 [Weeksellaceae bacterium]|nr:hypothetical protein [Weeksellaceae bacterium]
MTKKTKCIVISAAGIVLLLAFIAYFYGNHIVSQQIAQNLEEQLPDNVNLTYKDLKADIVRGTFYMSDAELALQDQGINVKFASVNFSGIKLRKLFDGDTIVIGNCKLRQADVLIDNSKRQTKETKDTLREANKVIWVQNFNLIDSKFDFKDEKGKEMLKFNQADAYFVDLFVLTAPQDDENAITYTFVNLIAKELEHPLNHLETLSVGKLEADTTDLKLNKLSIKPKFSRDQYQQHISEERDVIDLDIENLTAENYEYSFDDEDPFFKSSAITLENPVLSVYRDKRMPDQTPRKPLYSEMLRELDLRLEIDKVQIQNAEITYEEQLDKNPNPGKLTFNQMYATIAPVYNRDASKSQVNMDAKAQFMNHAPTEVNWKFHILQPADQFTISGQVNQLRAQELNSFFINNLNAKASGTVNSALFNFSGNDVRGGGQMDMNYDDFKIELINEETKEKKGLQSFLANLFVRSDKDMEDTGTTEINVTRDQTKSFFNYWWLMLKEGLKQNMLRFGAGNSETNS